MPCANYAFLKKLRAASTAEDKRKLVVGRLAERRMRQKDKAAVVAGREAYLEMYKAFCSSAKADAAVCKPRTGKRSGRAALSPAGGAAVDPSAAAVPVAP